ncbi:MAG: permease prefix domain 1-containing protein [Treponema sp.]|nr:permease prefix domain 1-containing protein [Treponema sp.]
MNAKEFVDSLFEGYEQTTALAEFKEELLGNLNAKIDNLIKKGMDAQTAFAKASAELGDVSTLADELSLKKRTQVFEEVYMDIRQYMTPGRVASYVVFGILALFGVTSGCIAFFATGNLGLDFNLRMASLFGPIMPFITAAIAGLTCLGVTQETASYNPVSKKRSALYTVAATLISFGIFTMPLVYFGSKYAKEINQHAMVALNVIVPILALAIPFVLPGIGILVYLILTEKNRLKPWAKSFRDKAAQQEKEIWGNPAFATRFGLFSGALWMFSIGLFFLLGYLFEFKYSWLIFIFTIPVQLLIQARMTKSDKR